MKTTPLDSQGDAVRRNGSYYGLGTYLGLAGALLADRKSVV